MVAAGLIPRHLGVSLQSGGEIAESLRLLVLLHGESSKGHRGDEKNDGGSLFHGGSAASVCAHG